MSERSVCSGHGAINIVHAILFCAVLRDRLLYRTMFAIAVCQCLNSLNNKRILYIQCTICNVAYGRLHAVVISLDSN